MKVPLTFGTKQRGGKADPVASRALIEISLSAGITDFDRACGYTDGMAETLLGQFAPQNMHQTAADLGTLARDIGIHPTTLAVAWVVAHPARPSPVSSADCAAQLRLSLAAAKSDMTPILYAQVGALSPALPPATDRLEKA